jgi:hypothetical protein
VGALLVHARRANIGSYALPGLSENLLGYFAGFYHLVKIILLHGYPHHPI